MTNDDISTYLTIMLGPILIILIIISISLHLKKNRWISLNEFEIEKKKLKTHCSEQELLDFLSFLNNYEGGYIRRKSGTIVYRDYSGKEKGDLKGIYYNIVFPNPNISVSVKEEFRRFINSVGVNGLSERPSYETREAKLKNNKTGEEFFRKEVGNTGEQIVRNTIKGLNFVGYDIINGPVLKSGHNTIEYDHIVIGNNGIFCIETKAFGMSNGKDSHAALFIDKGDKWILRKNKINKELKSPTQQMSSEKEHLQKILSSAGYFEVHPVLVLSNSKLFIKKNITLPYNIVRIDELNTFIMGYDDSISESEKKNALFEINKSRIN